MIEATGFNCAPEIRYGEDGESEIWVDRSKRGVDKGPIYTKIMTPAMLSLFLENKVKILSCGFEHCVLSTESGRVASWGCGASGSLG